MRAIEPVYGIIHEQVYVIIEDGSTHSLACELFQQSLSNILLEKLINFYTYIALVYTSM